MSTPQNNNTLLSMLRMLVDDSGQQIRSDVLAFLDLTSEINLSQKECSFATSAIQTVINFTQDPQIGLKIAKFISPNVFHRLGYLFMTAPNLEASFKRVSELPAAYLNAASIHSEFVGNEFVVTVSNPVPDTTGQVINEGAIAILTNYMQWVLKDRLDDYKITFSHSSSTSDETYIKYLGTLPVFDAAVTSLSIPKNIAMQPLHSADPQYHQHLLIELNNLQERVSNNFSDRVRQEIRQRLPEGTHTKQKIASTLGVSEKTLERRLVDEKTSYRDLVTETRQELSRLYLSDSNCSLDEVASKLGYSDRSAFSKAYKNWTGKSPRS